jgi:uncharacterized LabA/DUF88 family protein
MSIIKQKNQRVAIFIDAQNLYHSARSLYGSNVNFKSILEDTLSERELVRAIAYVITTETGEEKNFFEALKKAGIETKSKDLQIFLGGAKKGDWDVGMTVDAIRLASSVDAVIIISGDGDFIPLVEYLKFNSGCQVEVATFRQTASAGLVEVVDDFFDLSEDLDRYLIKKYRNNFRGHRHQNSYKKNHNHLPSNEKEMTNSSNSNILESETPEMIAERIAGKRSIPKKTGLQDSDSKKIEVKKATKVEITRVKKSDMIKKKTSINIKKKSVARKKIDLKEKNNKVVKNKIKKKAVTKKIVKKKKADISLIKKK